MGEVVTLNMATRLDIPVSRVLKSAKKADLKDVMVIGYDADGDFYFASSVADGPECLWRLQVAIKKLLEIGGA